MKASRLHAMVVQAPPLRSNGANVWPSPLRDKVPKGEGSKAPTPPLPVTKIKGATRTH